MKNKITATIEFSFKGQVHTPSTTIDLDETMEKQGCIPSLYNLIARENNIDEYSYEYEVIHAERIQFSNAKGMAADFLENNKFDSEGFAAQWHENKVINQLASIAKQEMDINDLENQPQLKRALFAAYNTGKKTNS